METQHKTENIDDIYLRTVQVARAGSKSQKIATKGSRIDVMSLSPTSFPHCWIRLKYLKSERLQWLSKSVRSHRYKM